RTYFHLIGQPYPTQETPRHDVLWLRGAADIKAARFYVRRGDLSWRQYLRSLARPIRFAVWGAPDLGLFLGWVRATTLGVAKFPLRLARKVVRGSQRITQSVS